MIEAKKMFFFGTPGSKCGICVNTDQMNADNVRCLVNQ